jgi:hypothetical protein
MTYAQLRDEIAKALGYVHDDSLFTQDALLADIVHAVNKLSAQDLNSDIGSKGDGRGAQDKLTHKILPVVYNATPDDTEWAYHWMVIPDNVQDLTNGAGVSLIRYHRPSLPINCPPSIARATFTQTTTASLSAIYDSKMQRPKATRPYFTRAYDQQQERIYFFGLDPQVTKLLVGLYIAPSFLSVDPNEEIRLGPHRIYDLKRMVLDMNMWPLQIPQERLKNDGRDLEPDQPIQTRPIISVNDPSVVSQNPDAQ